MTGLVVQALSLWLFSVGIIGVLVRRSPLSVFMSIELMLNAANLLLVLALERHGSGLIAMNGLLGVLFVVAVAGAEVAVGLAVMVMVFQRENEVDLDGASSLKG